MRRQRGSDVLDLSIHGDDLERDRIQLEHNLQHTNLSLELSGSRDAFGDDSVEMPRHNSINAQYSDFDSFIRKGGVNEDDPNNPWSYRTGDDEEGISPYGHTVSTAAHHASALTLSAGLGRRGARRDRSLSGAEYDPDRPLRDLMANADSKLSMFDMDPSRSRYPPPNTLSLDPLIVDNTAELDRVLQSGHAPPVTHSRSVRLRSPHSSHTSSSGSESETSFSGARPKLSDALRSVSFSPKRPRGASPRTRSSPLPTTAAQITPGRVSSPLARQVDELDAATPKPTKRSNPAPARANSTPAVRLHPATPAASKVHPSRLGRGDTKAANESTNANRTMRKPAVVEEEDGNPFNDVMDNFAKATITTAKRAATAPSRSFVEGLSKSRIHLPDVTGLTNAVDSPAKGLLNRQPFGGDTHSKETEAQLRAVLVAVQSKLQSLEDENSISRRRMRELEHELDMCKKEVARERTRILEHENLSFHPSPRRRDKGKARARDRSNFSMDRADVSFRFREVVEEKKALEALIDSLRSHLSRLTAELSSHRELLQELRQMRESDARALKEKSTEVHLLRTEVERLAGEVEVLRGVVEDGLEQRRAAREASAASSANPDSDEEDEVDEEEEPEDEDESDVEPFDPQSIPGSSRDQTAQPDRTMRTDRATIDTPQANQTLSNQQQRFIDNEEFSRISAEIRERRSEHSAAGSTIGSPSQLQSYFNSGEHEREEETRGSIPPLQRTESSVDPGVASRDLEPTEMDIDPPSPGQADLSRAGGRSRGYHDYDEQVRRPERPVAPTPGHARRNPRSEGAAEEYHALDHEDEQDGAPFPKIRGARLERLFFSAEHHADRCTMCRRRRVRPGGAQATEGGRPLSPAWLPSRMGRQQRTNRDEEDEGFEEGSEILEEDQGRYARRSKQPPQSVLASVIQEMEEDFAHYKHVYIELADQYKIMDAASDVPKRNLIATHLREAIDIIEQKGDQIASLYDLLEFKDKPLR